MRYRRFAKVGVCKAQHATQGLCSGVQKAGAASRLTWWGRWEL